jgi:predicted ATPase/class 3 adenylate cyclase
MARQPSGTVTFLLTDIEGSTRLLAELGQATYSEALDTHREVLRAAFERHGGYEVDCEGDAFFVAFQSAGEALAAAAEAQAGVAAHAWPDGHEFRVRMGLHTGEPLLAPPKYVGLDVHKAARLMAAGHGGQVLFSQSTRDLVGNEFELRDLGEHRFKDLSTPERVYQLGEDDCPPLKSLYQTNLPISATPFLGREDELVEVSELLARDEVRLLTLTGPGGTGKTRLGLEVVGAVAESFPDGVWWVGLAPLDDPALVLPAVAQIFDITDQPGRELGDVLADVLGGKRLVLLLDNAEHLLPHVAGAIASLRDTNGPKLVVTSRERLQVVGEHVYAVPSLAEADAIELFSARARALVSGFEATPAVAELCARLDNLPLAIELAAARTNILSPTQILERLSRRRDLLRAGRDADPRHETLRSTITWSYDLLDAEERELFARLAVFSGGTTLGAAEEICEADLDTLASLVDKSLLRRGGERFWMLETIREYAAERLDESPDAEAVRSRHGEFYEHLAAQAEQGMRGPSALFWLERVEEELPNLRSTLARALEAGDPAALRTAAALFRYWAARSGASEGLTWLERALATDIGSLGDRAKGSNAAAQLAFFQGDRERAGVFLGDAVELARLAGDDGSLAAALASAGSLHAEQGDRDAALRLIGQSREVISGLTEPWVRAEALHLVAVALHIAGEHQRSDVINREVLAIKRELGDELIVAHVLNNIGWVELVSGNHEKARVSFEESLGLARRLADTYTIALALGNLGLLALLEGRNAEAIAVLDEVLRSCVMRGDRRVGTEAVLGLAAAHAALGNDELAIKLDAIQQGLEEAMGVVYAPRFYELLERPIRSAREKLGPAVAEALAEQTGRPTLEGALAELERAAVPPATAAG